MDFATRVGSSAAADVQLEMLVVVKGITLPYPFYCSRTPYQAQRPCVVPGNMDLWVSTQACHGCMWDREFLTELV
jgi:hypothetical protein